MLQIGLNQMTVPTMSVGAFLRLAKSLGCDGVECRDDLEAALFDGMPPQDMRAMTRKQGLRLFGLAEVYGFNAPHSEILDKAAQLIQTAQSAGAEGVALIPMIGTAPIDRARQRAMLRSAIKRLTPLFAGSGVRGFIEPLGFGNSTLRFKSDVVDALRDLDAIENFALIHDTFRHHLAGESAVFGAETAMVHVSGVAASARQATALVDADRGLVGADDRLDNINQLNTLLNAGYTGPMSIEAFAPDVHKMTDPAAALAGSIAFIADKLDGVPA